MNFQTIKKQFNLTNKQTELFCILLGERRTDYDNLAFLCGTTVSGLVRRLGALTNKGLVWVDVEGSTYYVYLTER